MLQRHVTRTLPRSPESLEAKFGSALANVRAHERHGSGRRLADAVFYEFGVGWDLAHALSLWCLGVERQILVDREPNVRLDLVEHTRAALHALLPALERRARRPLRDPPSVRLTNIADVAALGLDYRAPCDARATGLLPGSVDLVASVNTLEHVPEPDLVSILAECRRLLRDDGVARCGIDLQDHFSYVDASLSPYNFLRYSRRAWSVVNSSLMYQNRLRAPDYLDAFAAAGLDVVKTRRGEPTAADLAALAELGVAPEFAARYTLEELAVRRLTVIARPRPGGD